MNLVTDGLFYFRFFLFFYVNSLFLVDYSTDLKGLGIV